MRRATPALLLVLLTWPAVTAAEQFPAHCIAISDGDTLTVLKSGREQIKVRLEGIDAPESGQPFGTRSRQALADLTFQKAFTVLVKGRDRYGRTLAVLMLPNGQNINQEMVRGGWAWWYREFAPNDRDLAQLESEARAAKRGLWSDPGAVPPWDRRKPPAGSAVPAGSVIGNRNSHVFHSPMCASVTRMKESNRVPFSSAADAERAGYRKAGDCRW